MVKRHRLRDTLVTAYWSVIGMLSAVVCTIHPVMADSIFDRIRSIVADIYGQIVAISTIVAVTVASIALIVRMISRNQRAVDEATSWLKRIVVMKLSDYPLILFKRPVEAVAFCLLFIYNNPQFNPYLRRRIVSAQSAGYANRSLRRDIMENTWSWDNPTVDYTLLEKVNPVFNTAKMTLFQLAANGNKDAAALAKSMGLTLEATQDSANTKASPEQVLGGTIMLESRYRTMACLAERSGHTAADMPCGYTPRAIEFARKGLPYYALDLPVVIREAAEKILALIPAEQREFARFREVDATNYASLEKALEDIDGPVCITTEGLLMYFTDSEAGALCDNIRRILERKGGCWYTADVECSLQYILVMRALVGDRFMEIMKNAKQQTKDKSDVEIGKNALIASPADMEGSIRKAMAFLAKHGLKAERVNVGENMPKLDSLDRVTSEQAAAVLEGMKHCAFWKITPSGAAAALPSAETKGFHADASMQSGTLSLALTGRLDTITAPSLLSFFEKAKAEQAPDAVEVDCSRLEYISSAGLRVLLIMHKACKGGVSLHGENETVREILEQTGFDSIFH